MIEALQEQYGYLFEDNLLEEIASEGISKKVSKGTMLIDIGDPISYMPLLLKGAIKHLINCFY